MLTPPPPDDRRRTLTAVAVHGLSCLHGERRGVTMEGLRLFGAFRGQQRRSTSTAERLRRENYHGHGAIWGTGYIGVRCTQEVGSSSTEPSNRGRDSNTSRRFPWRHRVAARGAAQVAAATSSRRREYVQSSSKRGVQQWARALFATRPSPRVSPRRSGWGFLAINQLTTIPNGRHGATWRRRNHTIPLILR